MMSYTPIDRDRERLVEELAAARAYAPARHVAAAKDSVERPRARFALAGILRSHPVGV